MGSVKYAGGTRDRIGREDVLGIIVEVGDRVEGHHRSTEGMSDRMSGLD